MVSAPQINEKELIARLNQLYNLDITNIQFFPKGETSWGYLVTTADTKFWLKIYNKSFSYLEDAAELTYTLFSKCHITEIVHAIPSNTGKAVNQFENYSFVLFNFIEG